MTRIFFVLLLAVAAVFAHPAQAAFWKKNTATAITAGHYAASPSVAEHKLSPVFKALPGNHRHEGWEGIVALICGIVGLVTILPAIPAILFGYRGRYKARHRTLAKIGIILGTLTILAVIVTVLIISFYSYNSFDFLGLW